MELSSKKVKKNFKFQKLFLVGIFYASATGVYASNRTETISDFKITSPGSNIERTIEPRDLIHLHNEGAISTKEAKEYYRTQGSDIDIDKNQNLHEYNKIKNSSNLNNNSRSIVLEFNKNDSLI